MPTATPKPNGGVVVPMTAPILDALNPTVGNGPVQKYVPLIVAVATVAAALGAIFGFVPGLDAEAGLALLLGAGAGYHVRSQA